MQEIEFYFYITRLSYNFYVYPNGPVGQFYPSLGITPLTWSCVKVLQGGVGHILTGFGRGHLGTQVVTETSLLSVHVAVSGPVPLSAAVLPLRCVLL